jgi:membrane-associated phospholipid phosphatase
LVLPDFPAYLWFAITRLGGVGVTLPLALVMAAWLAMGYSWKMAARWLLVLAAAIVIITVTKIAFLGWGLGILALNFTGVSGHATLSEAVYPVAFSLMLARAGTVWRVMGVVAGLAMGIIISCSRIALAAHSPAEAIAGSALGALTALYFLRGWWHAQAHHRMRAAPVILSLVALTFALHNVSIPTYRWMARLALVVSGHKRPFVRARWLHVNTLRNADAPGATPHKR